MRISKEKREKISEQIITLLYSISPRSFFTVQIAKELARDEEFTKKLLLELERKNLVIGIKKNPKGVSYLRRSRWKISDIAYQAYKSHSESR